MTHLKNAVELSKNQFIAMSQIQTIRQIVVGI